MTAGCSTWAEKRIEDGNCKGVGLKGWGLLKMRRKEMYKIRVWWTVSARDERGRRAREAKDGRRRFAAEWPVGRH